MKLDLEMAEPEPVPTEENPFALGWRYTKGRSKGQDWRVPLTEDDLVYPQEDDFVVNNEAHHDDRGYLIEVFKDRIAGKPGLRVLGDHLIDFEHPAVKKYLGPDVIVFNGEPRTWNRKKAVFPVKRMKARPLFAIEITSPTTRKKDLTTKPKVFYTVGIPLYVLIDLSYGGGRNPHGIIAFQAGPTEYEPLPKEANGRVWLEVVEVFLAVENDRVVCYDRDGQRIPDNAEVRQKAREARARAEAAEALVVAEKARADTEKARANESARKLAELEAEICRVRGEPPPSPAS